jgi:hypothetical protein
VRLGRLLPRPVPRRVRLRVDVTCGAL